MRDAWLPLSLVLLVGAAPLACGQAFELTGSAASSTGAGGAASAASAGGGGDVVATSGGGDAATTSAGATTSTGMAMCTVSGDCAGPITLCGEPVCQGGKCGFHVLQSDGPSFSQRYGDCHVETCTKAKLSNEENDADIYDDGNPCTKDTCKNGVAVNEIKVGAPCDASGVCSAKGTCVECVTNGTCGANKPICINNHCSVATCQNGGLVADGNETDVDCGGDECGPCDAGMVCKADSDCKSLVCKDAFVGAPYKQCQIPTCADGVKNGTETDIDCGGAGCPAMSKCGDAQHCAVHGDCKSTVCQGGICQKASCSDGVKNGSETGIDCGGGGAGCALKCPPGG